MAKFYETTRGARPVQAPGISIRFNPYELSAGNVMAVYATDDAKVIAALDKLVEGKKHDVFAITEKQYGECLKKKSAASNPFGNTLFDQQIRRDAPAVAVDTEPAAKPETGLPVGSVEEALTVGTAE